MGYERNERRYGRDYGRPDHERDENRAYGRGRADYGRAPQGYDYDDRGFFDRAGDEVRSWFGDDDAERRRRMDERSDERGRYDDDGRSRGDRERSRAFYPGSVGDPSGAGLYSGRVVPGSDSYASDWGRDQGRRPRGAEQRDRNEDRHDPSYRSWRDRQMDSYDRDYDEYRRENQSRFDQEFAAWRQNRETQRASLRTVREHQDVVGSDGQHVGTVDHVRGDRILLTKTDKDAQGHHHSIPCSWIQAVADKVTINKTAAEAQQHWKDEERSAFFGPDGDQREDRGPHALNRSFSGTY